MATFHGQAKPGDLCLIIQGPAAGISCTFIREIPWPKIRQELMRIFPEHDIEIQPYHPNMGFAEIDKKVDWTNQDRGLVCQLPYEAIPNLMPIQPPASATQGEKQKELDHA